jgi:hypothetical protein
MQFDPVDTTCKIPQQHIDSSQLTWIGTLATACTWCVVEVACGTIALCLPTLRPLMLMISTKFESIGSRKESGARNNVPTELITIGGNGGKTGPFHRINDEYETNFSQLGLVTSDGSIPHVDQSDRGSGDELPLHEGKKNRGPR